MAVPNDASAEHAFVVACLGHCLFPNRPLPAPTPGLDWGLLSSLLARHGLTERFAALVREEPDAWPQALREDLRDERYRALLRGDRCIREVGAVLRALRAAAIPTAVLKGWAIISRLYDGDYGRRTYVDIDLLVRPCDAARAEEAILDLGYIAPLEVWPGFSRRYGVGRVFLLPPKDAEVADFAVGLHWGLLDTPFYRRNMPVDNLMERAEPLCVAGVEVLRLAVEDDLVYACGHLALHHEYDEALFRYYEMAAGLLKAASAFDWRTVKTRGREWKLVLPLQRVTTRLEALWPGIVPAPAFAQIQALRPTRYERLVHDAVQRYRANHTVRALLVWLTLPGLWRRGAYLVEHAFPRPAYLRQRYGEAPLGLWPLLYLRRLSKAIGLLGQRRTSTGSATRQKTQ